MTVRPIRWEMVLIQVVEDEVFVELVKDESDMFEQWFIDLKAWSPELVQMERYAWIRCQGVPPHAWGEDLIRNLVVILGRYVYVDAPTTKKRLDVAWMLIATSAQENINQMVRIKINGVVFSIKMVEEPFSNPNFHIGGVYKRGGGTTKVSSSSSESGDSEGIPSEASWRSENSNFKIF